MEFLSGSVFIPITTAYISYTLLLSILFGNKDTYSALYYFNYFLYGFFIIKIVIATFHNNIPNLLIRIANGFLSIIYKLQKIPSSFLI